jgi:hypothetical protein
MRPSSLASWQQRALDLTVEACHLTAALRPLPPQGRQKLEEEGLREALGWLREASPSPTAVLASLLEETEILEALASVDLPPPWGDPPERLREGLAQLEERARLALRHHAVISAPLPLRESTPPWPGPSPSLSGALPSAAPSGSSPPSAAPSGSSPPSAAPSVALAGRLPASRPSLATLQAQARRRLQHLASPPEGSPPHAAGKVASPALDRPTATLCLASRGGLSWNLGPLAGFTPDCPSLALWAGPARLTLLTSNLRSGISHVPVPPSVEDYRLTRTATPDVSGEIVEVPAVPGEIMEAAAPGQIVEAAVTHGQLVEAAVAPGQIVEAAVAAGQIVEVAVVSPLAGLDPAKATAFRVRRDGSADRVPQPRLHEGEHWRLLVPPSLTQLTLPAEAWSLGHGWRAFELHLSSPQSTATSALLKAIGLASPASVVSLSWEGVAPVRYRMHQGNQRLPVFAAHRLPLVRMTRRGVPGRLLLLLTSEQDSAPLEIAADEGVDVSDLTVALDELEPGAFCLDLVPDDPQVEPAHLSFFVEREEARSPAAVARARVGSREVSLLEDPEIPCALRGDETVTLELPPLWPVHLRWRGSQERHLGRLYADGEGRLDLSPTFASLARSLARSAVADLVVDAGELGRLTLLHERPFEPEAVIAALLSLLRERSSLLALGTPDLLRVTWIEPVLRALGYELSEPRRASPDALPYQRLTTLSRQGRTFEQESYALLFVSREAPSADEIHRLLRQARTPRALWTDGLRWRLIEQGRRHTGEPLDLVLSPDGAARTSLARLVARLGA